ncbi:MAG: YsnF/AvaK domain-containing protein [Blastocatellia bacterium]|nr:YsnF/AvaK domain-containing protein [Blastocatellia bacterium]
MATRSEKAPGNRAAGAKNKSAVIPVIQEQATVSKRVVETGKVRIAKHIRQYEEVVDVPHFQEEVKVDRVFVDQIIDEAPEVRTEGDVTIIPVVEERYVLEKRLVLVEELHISKDRKETHHPHTVTVMKEEVEVERLRPDDNEGGRAKRAAGSRAR